MGEAPKPRRYRRGGRLLDRLARRAGGEGATSRDSSPPVAAMAAARPDRQLSLALLAAAELRRKTFVQMMTATMAVVQATTARRTAGMRGRRGGTRQKARTTHVAREKNALNPEYMAQTIRSARLSETVGG